MEYNYPKFTPEMKQTHTILIPNMAITQFRLLEYALRYDGYKCEILGNCGSAVAQLGLKYVHNDTCYPALLVIGQFLDALNSVLDKMTEDDYKEMMDEAISVQPLSE